MTTIHHGDCLEVLREMPDNSVDAIITDPPYGLSNTSPDKVTEAVVKWASGDREFTPKTSGGFMGAAWDSFVPPPAVWDECFRVLKPGGHLAAFAGTRTQDLMGISIRLAGFDIRENLAWIYGSGMPKSLNVSKAIDKANGRKFEDRYALGRHIKERRTARGFTRADVNAWVDSVKKCEHYESQNGTDARVPTLNDYGILKDKLGLSDEFDEMVERVEAEREVIGTRRNVATRIYDMGEGKRLPDEIDVTISATDEARKWEGWGTATKPAHEPVILARKPLSEKTVAANTLTWGTGGLNIDATRIGVSADDDIHAKNPHTKGGFGHGNASVYGDSAGAGAYNPAQGRWPANVLLDNESAPALDEQSEGASRFFKVAEPDPPFMYAAKAPKRERPSYATEDGQTVQHATVKPLSIMQWLVKLVTPEGGTVLDPFAGSGTTVEAAILEGFNVIGIEREAEYLPLIQQRIDRATDVLPMAS